MFLVLDVDIPDSSLIPVPLKNTILNVFIFFPNCVLILNGREAFSLP
jgi:hypothetical protein